MTVSSAGMVPVYADYGEENGTKVWDFAEYTAELAGTEGSSEVITEECDSVSAQCTVTVTENTVKVSEVSIRNADAIEIAEVLELEADVTENASNRELVWLSSDGSTVSVNNEGTIQGLKAGSAKIYAVAADSVTDTEALEALSDMRTIGEDSAELRSLLEDADHDSITTGGVYWRGGASSGSSPRYIAFTPETDGTLIVQGKMNSSGGRWGISDSQIVTSLKADGSSATGTSLSTVSKECSAGVTYYIMPKDRSATVTSVSFAPNM